MENTNINKVIYGENTLIDLTADTATQDNVLLGYTFHDRSGASKIGTCNYDVNSQDATVVAGEILSGKTAYARSTKVVGTMPNRGDEGGSISTKDGEYTIAQGFHDGSGKVGIAFAEKTKLIATNIREGVTILGVLGTMSGREDERPQAKTVTPDTEGFTVTPDEDYTCLSQVTVNAIPYEEVDNSAGGLTVIIAKTI